MGNDFRHLTAKVWANLDNPIKSGDFFKVLINVLVCRPLRWHTVTICDVTTVQLSNGTVHRFHKHFLFIKIYLPSILLYLYMLGLR